MRWMCPTPIDSRLNVDGRLSESPLPTYDGVPVSSSLSSTISPQRTQRAQRGELWGLSESGFGGLGDWQDWGAGESPSPRPSPVKGEGEEEEGQAPSSREPPMPVATGTPRGRKWLRCRQSELTTATGDWIPAFAGMTDVGVSPLLSYQRRFSCLRGGMPSRDGGRWWLKAGMTDC